MVTEKSRKFSIYLFNIERTIPFYKSLHLPCLLSFVKKRTGAFVCQEICSFTSSFSPTHLSTGQYRVSLFTWKSIFIVKKSIFFYAKEHALIFFCRYLWCYRKSPYESIYIPSKDLQERKLKLYDRIPKNNQIRRTLLDYCLIHYTTLRRSHLQIWKPSSMGSNNGSRSLLLVILSSFVCQTKIKVMHSSTT